MADLNSIEKKLDLILQKQQEMENKINKMEHIVNKIESDIYLDDGYNNYQYLENQSFQKSKSKLTNQRETMARKLCQN